MIPSAVIDSRSDLKEKLRSYLAERRICSLESLSFRFGSQHRLINPLLNELINEKRIRIAERSCSSCSTCDSFCDVSGFDESAIIISLEKKLLEDDDS